jgi:hypothetical protein
MTEQEFIIDLIAIATRDLPYIGLLGVIVGAVISIIGNIVFFHFLNRR